jgi:hypothetical protein
VLPLPTHWASQFGISLGDYAAVLFSGRLTYAVFADYGPSKKIGEGSVELFRRLGMERVRPNGSVIPSGSPDGVLTIIFPESGNETHRADEPTLLAALQSHGPNLLVAAGGTLLGTAVT